MSVRRDSISSLEKSLGIATRKGRGKFIGLVVGAAAGTAIGVAIAVSQDADCEASTLFYCTVGEGAVDSFITLLGLAIGAWSGYLLGGWIGDGIEYEKWEEVPWKGAGLRASARPVESGMQLGVTLRF